ncbi:MAG TPA: ABC transporter substrate-binding protein [Candidatus Micrarchaeia archaeon]|nr:ABC transporter substrate-binding protein [Candidatus Micrarchaeia archaeon]
MHVTPPRSMLRASRLLTPVLAAAIAASATVAVLAAPATSARGTAAQLPLAAAAATKLQFAVFNPFSGGEAAYGPEKLAGCQAAATLIDKAGGVNGHQVYCKGYDDRDDPVDAVPAARQMLATASNLVGVIGPTSDSGAATAPIINAAHVTFFSDSGEKALNRTHFRYFWRIVPPDIDAGLAMALWAKHAGYKKIGLVFGNDVSEQGNVPAMVKGYTALGGKIVINQRVNLDAPSYETEVEAMLAAHPQAIFTEMDPQSAATYFSELRSLHGPIPIIGTGNTLSSQWLNAVSQAVGVATFKRKFVGVQPYVPGTGPAWRAYYDSLRANARHIRDVAQYFQDPYAQAVYDSVNLMALAMEAAHSIKPVRYNSWVSSVVGKRKGAVVVHTFAAGKAALVAGRRIDYIGTVADIVFDRWHNSPGAFEAVRFVPSRNGQLNLPLITIFSTAQVAALSRKAGV